MGLLRTPSRRARAAAEESTVRNSRLAALALWLFAGVAVASDQFDRVRREIEDHRITDNAPAIAVGVSRGGQVLWTQGFGWADVERRIPATSRTAFKLAS